MRLLLFFCCIAVTTARSQNIDSLRGVIAAAPADTHQVMTYRQLYLALYNNDQTAELEAVAENGLALSRRLGYERGIDLFLFYKASALDIAGRGREAIPLFEEGLQLARSRNNKKGEADYHVNLGTAFHGLGDLDKALEHFLAAHDMYIALNLPDKRSKTLNNIGIIYRTQGKYDRAGDIYRQSLALKESLNDSLGMAASYQNLSALYTITGDTEKAIGYQQKALAFYEKLRRPEDVAGCHSLLGEIFFNAKKYPEAKTELRRAEAYLRNNTSVEYSAVTYRLLGSVALQENNPTTALPYLRESLQLARRFGQRESVADILPELARAEALAGNHAAAYRALQEAVAIRDTISESKRLELLEEMQAKFDVAQKDNDLKINRLELSRRTLERNWLIGGAALLALLSLAVFLGQRQRMRANKKIAEQAAELQAQRIRQLEQEGQLNALQAMIEGQEKERSRIAADLHDGLGGLLASVKSHFGALHAPASENALFEKTNGLIDEACGEVRRISHNMMPRALALAGLPGALEDLARDLERQGLRCELEIVGLEPPPDPARAVTIYRIIQELAHNAVKHAEATQLFIQLFQHDGALNIVVEDNGKGFDIQQALEQKGLGLGSIHSRVQFLQGSIDWDTRPGEGTSVNISFEW